MKQLRFAVVMATLLFAVQLHAQEDDWNVAPTKKPTPELKLDYRLLADQVRVGIDVKDSNQWKGLMQAYPGEQFFKRIKGLPGIENIQFTPGNHQVQDDYYDKEVIFSKRDSSLMVRIQGSAPFSMLFAVNESLKRCVADVSSHEDDEEALDKWGEPSLYSNAMVGIESPCRVESSMTVSGPIAVYGTIPGNFTNRSLLMNQIVFSWSIKNDFSKKDTELDSSFKIARSDFPVALRKMLQWTQGASTPFADIFMSNPQRNTLVQIGRVLTAKNKEILKGQ